MDGRRAVGRMPLLIALAAALMLGLLGMHVLGGHESAHGSSGAGGHADALAAPAAHAHLDGVAAPPRQPAGAPASDDAAHAEDAAEHAEVAAAPATCAGCADLPALTAACVLALLGGILLLVLPAGWRMPSPPVLPLTRVRADVVRPRAPSLHILCISRT